MLGGLAQQRSVLALLLLGCGGRAISSDDGGASSQLDASDASPTLPSPSPCPSNPGSGQEIESGKDYNRYYLVSVQISGAPCGVYSFTVDPMAPTASQIATAHLLKDGTGVSTLTYFWQTTVTDTESYTFKFQGYLSVTVKAAIGSLNLWDIPQDLFDGNHVVLVR
jgi:hypothetical protein